MKKPLQHIIVRPEQIIGKQKKHNLTILLHNKIISFLSNLFIVLCILGYFISQFKLLVDEKCLIINGSDFLTAYFKLWDFDVKSGKVLNIICGSC